MKVKPQKGITVEGCSVWKLTLVGHFVGQRLSYPTVNSIAHKLWDDSGLEEVVLSTDNGCFCFKFKSEEDLGSVLERAPLIWPIVYWCLKDGTRTCLCLKRSCRKFSFR